MSGPITSARLQLGAIPLRHKRGFWKVPGYPIMNTDQMVTLAHNLSELAESPRRG